MTEPAPPDILQKSANLFLKSDFMQFLPHNCGEEEAKSSVTV